MLAVFGKTRELSSPRSGSPRSPVGSKRRLESSLSPEEEEYVRGVLDGLHTSLPRRSRAFVQQHYFGNGANGIAYVDSLTHSLAIDRDTGHVTVFFSGELENNPAGCEDAEFVLQEYRRCFNGGGGGGGGAGLGGGMPTMDALARLRGPWAFVLYDPLNGRIVAARDPAGAEGLAWGTTVLTEGMLFASDKALLDGECADAGDFPASCLLGQPGAVFVSEDFSTAGTLTRLSPKGPGTDALEAAQQHEVLCRVESGSCLRRADSISEITSA